MNYNKHKNFSFFILFLLCSYRQLSLKINVFGTISENIKCPLYVRPICLLVQNCSPLHRQTNLWLCGRCCAHLFVLINTDLSEQLPCTLLFFRWFWSEFWISFKFHKPVSLTYRPKNDMFCLLITFSFPFWYLILRLHSQTWWRFYLFILREKVP